MVPFKLLLLRCCISLIFQERLTPLRDDELDNEVRTVSSRYASFGYRMVWAELQSKGVNVIRKRVRESMHRVDPWGLAQRFSVFIPRRKYSVPGPNALWHLDGNLKLKKRGFASKYTG